jgi:hypothetical protein
MKCWLVEKLRTKKNTYARSASPFNELELGESPSFDNDILIEFLLLQRHINTAKRYLTVPRIRRNTRAIQKSPRRLCGISPGHQGLRATWHQIHGSERRGNVQVDESVDFVVGAGLVTPRLACKQLFVCAPTDHNYNTNDLRRRSFVVSAGEVAPWLVCNFCKQLFVYTPTDCTTDDLRRRSSVAYGCVVFNCRWCARNQTAVGEDVWLASVWEYQTQPSMMVSGAHAHENTKK